MRKILIKLTQKTTLNKANPNAILEAYVPVTLFPIEVKSDLVVIA